MNDTIYRQDAIDALWKALFEYEDKMEKVFIESNELDVEDWTQHRIFVQNMNDIDRQTILNLPPAQSERKKGKWIKGGGQPYFRKHFDIVVCSICNKRGEHRWNYCPNCGSDNRGEQNE